MNLRVALASASITLAMPAFAGDDVADLSTAISPKNYIYLTFANGKFTYAEDTAGGLNSHELADVLVVARRGDLSVYLDYVNPLAYSWSVSEEDVADPVAEALAKFIETFNGFVGIIAPPEKTSKGGAHLPAVPAAPGGGGDKVELRAPDLLEWSMWTNVPDVGKKCIDASSTAYPAQTAALRDALSVADGDLYGSDRNDRNSYKFTEGSSKIVKDLVAQKDLPSFRNALDGAKTTLGELKTLNDNSALALAAVEKARKAQTWAAECGAFGEYSNLVIGQFERAGGDVLAARQKLLETLKTLLGELDTRTKQGVASQNCFQVASVGKLPSGKMRDITLVVRSRDVTPPAADRPTVQIDEKASLKATLRVRERHTIIVEFAPGLMYSTIKYPTYGTATASGNTVVKRGKDEQLSFAPVAMLNLVPNFGWRGSVYLVGQVGLGVARDYPLLCAGGGLRFGGDTKLSITAGWAWTWTRQLTNLKEGDQVSGSADIENDLSYQLTKASFYIGIQKGF